MACRDAVRPSGGCTGPDSVGHPANDGTLTSNAATVTVIVTARIVFPKTGVPDTSNRGNGVVGSYRRGLTGSAFDRVLSNQLDVQLMVR